MSAGSAPRRAIRIGVDLGGTKIAGLALGVGDRILAETRVLTPRGDYEATIRSIVDVVGALEREARGSGSVGIGIPGSIVPATGLVQNANSTCLNGQPLGKDLGDALGRPVRFANDANCLAMSEATDGAAQGARSVFAVIAGTGLGGGIWVNGELIEGARRIGGEWGHTPLPWMTAAEFPGPVCWCGRTGCLETFVSGTGLENDDAAATGRRRSAIEIVEAAQGGDPAARASLDRHASRFARGLALIANILDPEVVVLGGGLSQMSHLYDELPRRAAPYIFAEDKALKVLPPRWGDASGVRGAARLWPAVERA